MSEGVRAEAAGVVLAGTSPFRFTMTFEKQAATWAFAGAGQARWACSRPGPAPDDASADAVATPSPETSRVAAPSRDRDLLCMEDLSWGGGRTSRCVRIGTYDRTLLTRVQRLIGQDFRPGTSGIYGVAL